MTDWLVLAVLVAVALLALGTGLRLRRVAAASLATVAVLASIWALAVTAHTIDWHDADGWIDCWPHCTPLQDATRVVIIFAPMIAAVLLLVALVAVIAGWLQSYRAHPRPRRE